MQAEETENMQAEETREVLTSIQTRKPTFKNRKRHRLLGEGMVFSEYPIQDPSSPKIIELFTPTDPDQIVYSINQCDDFFSSDIILKISSKYRVEYTDEELSKIIGSLPKTIIKVLWKDREIIPTQ